MLELRTKHDIITALRERGIHLKKSLGQNLLIDHNLLAFIVREAAVDRTDLVLEVGAGSGLLTGHLAEGAGHVVAVEIDPRMVELFREHMAGAGNVSLLNCDVLESKSKLNPAVLDAVTAALHRPGISRLKCVANLPYAVSTMVIPLLLEGPLPVQVMVFTVQKEVSDRLAATPGTKDYGALSVIVQALARVEKVRTLGPRVFFPEPKVDSAVVRITPADERRRRIADYRTFAEVTRGLFTHRRKKIAGALALIERFRDARPALEPLIAAAGIEPGARADQLSVEQIILLSNNIAALGLKAEGEVMSDE